MTTEASLRVDALRDILMAPVRGLNVFRTGSLPSAPGERYPHRLAKDAGTTLAAYMALGYLLHQVRSRATRKKVDAGLKSYVNRAFPVLSPDPNLDDREEEARIREEGVVGEAEATSSSPAVLTKVAADSDEGSGWEDFMGTWLNKDTSIIHVAALLASAYGGFQLGSSLSKKRRARNESARLVTSIAKARNKLDAKLFERLKERAYLRKSADWQGLFGLREWLAGKSDLDFGMKDAAAGTTRVVTTTGLAVSLLAFLASKRYYDGKDPNRAALKKAQKQLKQFMQTPVVPQLQLRLPRELSVDVPRMSKGRSGFSLQR